MQGTNKQAEAPLSPRLVLLMAAACGAAVANIYYAQPLLSTIAKDFAVSDGTAGLLVTASQVGYALGLVLLVPVGDLLERRSLVTRILIVTALALAATAAAPSFVVLVAALAVVGLTSVVAQILVPMASYLAAEQERGKVVGNVMSGLLVGEVGGWRLVFGLSAASMLLLAAVLSRALPQVRPTTDLTYPGLLRSVWRLVVEQPTLRMRMLYRRARHGSVQRVVDDRHVPAVGQSLSLRRDDDRAVWSGRIGRSARRSGSGQAR